MMMQLFLSEVPYLHSRVRNVTFFQRKKKIAELASLVERQKADQQKLSRELEEVQAEKVRQMLIQFLDLIFFVFCFGLFGLVWFSFWFFFFHFPLLFCSLKC